MVYHPSKLIILERLWSRMMVLMCSFWIMWWCQKMILMCNPFHFIALYLYCLVSFSSILFHLRNCSSNIWSEAQETHLGFLSVNCASDQMLLLLFDSRPAQIQGGQVFPCILAKALPASLSYLCSPHLHLMPKTSRPLLRVTAPQVVLDSSPLLSPASAGGQFCNTGVIKHYG